MSSGAQLRGMMDQGPVIAPGAFNGLVGRMLRQAGHRACYLSGGAITAASGVPDVGIRGVDFFVRHIEEVVAGSRLPLIADADTGFGNIADTVWRYIKAGAAGLHIEDQTAEKRCGHLDGKTLVSAEEMMQRVGEAVRAAWSYPDHEFIVCARTDARGVEGMQGAIQRALCYIEAGAEMIFPEGLVSVDEFAEFAAAMRRAKKPPYLLANMTEFGKTPHIPVSKFGELGYHVVIFPVTTLRIAMAQLQRFLDELLETGTAERWTERMLTRNGLYDVLGYDPKSEKPWDACDA